MKFCQPVAGELHFGNITLLIKAKGLSILAVCMAVPKSHMKPEWTSVFWKEGINLKITTKEDLELFESISLDIGRIEYTDVKKPEPKDGEVLQSAGLRYLQQ